MNQTYIRSEDTTKRSVAHNISSSGISRPAPVVQRATKDLGTANDPINIELPENYTAAVSDVRNEVVKFLTEGGPVNEDISRHLESDDSASWIGYAFMLYSKNQLPGVDARAIMEKVIQYSVAGKCRTRPGDDNFESEVLVAIGWFETKSASEAVDFDEDKLKQVATVYEPPAVADEGEPENIGVLKPEIMSNSLSPLVLKYIEDHAPRGDVKSFDDTTLGHVKNLGDLIQQSALQYFAPYIDKPSNNIFAINWQYSGNISDATKNEITQEHARAFLENRITTLNEDNNNLIDGRTIFQVAGYSRARDREKMIGFIDHIIRAKKEDLAKIIHITPFNNGGRVALVPQQKDAPDAGEVYAERWSQIDTICHEFMHVVQHPALKDAGEKVQNNQVIKEGMVEAFAYELKMEIRRAAQVDPTLKAALEAGINSSGQELQMPKLDYGNLAADAWNIIRTVGVKNARLAFFLGDYKRLILAPEQVGKSHKNEEDAVYPYDYKGEYDAVPFKLAWLHQYHDHVKSDGADNSFFEKGVEIGNKLEAIKLLPPGLEREKQANLVFIDIKELWEEVTAESEDAKGDKAEELKVSKGYIDILHKQYRNVVFDEKNVLFEF